MSVEFRFLFHIRALPVPTYKRRQIRVEMGFIIYWIYSAIIVTAFTSSDVCASPCGRRDKIQMIVMSFKNRDSASTSSPLPHFECYLGREDGGAIITARRAYRTKFGGDQRPQPTLDSNITGLPGGTFAQYFALNINDNGAFGVFNCRATKNGRQDTTIMTIFMRSDSYVVPGVRQFTQTVDTQDEHVIIYMDRINTDDIFNWRINGSDFVQSSSGSDYISEDYELISGRPVKIDDDGLYECHIDRRRDEARHALKRLIVRACVSGKWGPPGCTGICDYCYNGGVCDDETGRCICPPGFMGENCLTECGGDKFGYSCEFECSPTGRAEGCAGRQFCLIDPFGCRCSTGFQGLSCTTGCGPGKFGAGCLQNCHCSGDSCDRFTGICHSGVCEDRWSGSNCQIPDICPGGYFGDNCTDKCRCVNGTACDRLTGRCPERICAPGAMSDPQTSKCEECPDGFYGDSCKGRCHCESDACDKTTGECVGCCKHDWVEFEPVCQQGFIEGDPLKVNPNQGTEVSCTYTQLVTTNYLTIALSRTPGRYTEVSVTNTRLTRDDTIGDFRLVTYLFSLPDAGPDDLLYCQLLLQASVVAWIDTTFRLSELPVLITPPISQFKNQSSITISWLSWKEGRDVGDPPIVAYIPYYKRADDWINGSAVYPNETLQYDVHDLEPDAEYEFAIVTVREGPGGEGPMSPSVTVKTLCNELSSVSTEVKATLTEMNAVNVSWKIDSSSSACSTLSYTIYLIADGDTEQPILTNAVDENKTWIIVKENLEPGQSYTFRVALTTDESSDEAISSPSNSINIIDEGPPTIIIYIIPAVLVLLLVVVIVALLFYRRKGRGNDPLPPVPAAFHNNAVSIGDQRKDLTKRGEGNPDERHSENDNSEYMDLHERNTKTEGESRLLEVPARNVKIISLLPGGGLMVYSRATLTRGSGSNDAVVKSPSGEAPINLEKIWSAEIEALRSLPKDVNLVQTLGWCSSLPKLLLFEFINGTNLVAHLTENFSMHEVHQYGNTRRERFEVPETGTFENLPGYALDVARGLKFLLAREFIHPGIRARKVLVDLSGKCKIYDFVSVDRAKKMTSLLWKESAPYQWMPPEFLLLDTVAPPGDVWSFGVLMWEIFSYGSQPYPGEHISEVESSLRKKERLAMPKNCPGAIWQLMNRCWDQTMDTRPKIQEIASNLAAMCNDDKEYDEIPKGVFGNNHV